VKILGYSERAMVTVQVIHHKENNFLNMVGTMKVECLEEFSESALDSPLSEAGNPFEKLLEESKMEAICSSSTDSEIPIATEPASASDKTFECGAAQIESETSSEILRGSVQSSESAPEDHLMKEKRIEPEIQESCVKSKINTRLERASHCYPSGVLPFNIVMEIVKGIKSKKFNARDVLASMLDDGAVRSIQGDTIRAVLQNDLDPHGVGVQVLRNIHSIELKGQVLAVRFIEPNYKGRYVITMPSSKKWTLRSKNRRDPYLVHHLNRATESSSEVRKFSLAPTVRLRVTKEGIGSIFKGDVVIKSLIKLNVDMKTCRVEGKIATDRSGRPYLVVDKETGRPLVVGGRYVPQTFDEWLHVTVFGYKTWIGLKSSTRGRQRRH